MIGTRTVRGPHWNWKNQDSGEGHLGTITRNDPDKKSITVQWDCRGDSDGTLFMYRAGDEHCYDLRVFDTSATGNRHDHVTCDICKKNNILGLRWKCNNCVNFDLCTSCYMADKHDMQHTFTRYDMQTHKGVKVAPRSYSTKITAHGLKSSDWCGQHYTNPVQYYRDHLPIVGCEMPITFACEQDSCMYSVGDRVIITLEIDILKQLQAEHGGWSDDMMQICNMVGTISFHHTNGDAEVSYELNNQQTARTINKSALTKVGPFSVGGSVLICDKEDLRKYQKLHASVTVESEEVAGNTGIVRCAYNNGNLLVEVCDKILEFSPLCCTAVADNVSEPASGSTNNENNEIIHTERMMQDEGFKVFLAAQRADNYNDPIHHLAQQIARGTINQSEDVAPTQDFTSMEPMMRDEGFKAFLATQKADSNDPIHHLVQQMERGTINQSEDMALSKNFTSTSEVPTMNILQKDIPQSDGYELATMMTKGTKVKRGKDWHYGNQDGNGEGTVTQPVDLLGIIHVKWDANGKENNYKMGMDDQFDLMLACDSTTVYNPDSDEEILQEHEAFRSMVLGSLHGNIGGLLGHDLGELMRQLQSESDSGDESSSDSSSSDSSSSDSSSSDSSSSDSSSSDNEDNDATSNNTNTPARTPLNSTISHTADATNRSTSGSRAESPQVDKTCAICLDRDRGVVFTCGHGTCEECSKSLRKCHICRKKIKEVIKIY